MTNQEPSVLLVDDDVVFGRIMQKVAQNQHVRLKYVSSVKDLERMPYQKFDVALLDFDLGTITGIQLSRLLPQYFGSVPVVLISQYRDIPKHLWPTMVRGFVPKASGAFEILSETRRLLEAVGEGHLSEGQEPLKRSVHDTLI